MSPPWSNIFASQPADGQQVWIRRLFQEAPFKMYWHAATWDFTSLEGHAVVSGAGDAAVNGAYLLCGDFVGFPLYNLPSTLYFMGVFTAQEQWVIEAQAVFTVGGKLYTSPVGVRPTGTWSVGVDTAPAPTVTVSMVCPWWMVSRWRPL